MVDSIYAASLDPSGIEAMLSRLADWLGTDAADYYIQEDGVVRHAAVTGLPEDRFRDYVEYYHGLNPRLVYIQDLREGRVVSDHDYLTDHQIRRSPYFQEFLASTDYREFLGFVLIREGSWFVGGGVHLPRRHGAPESREYRKLETLVPHLRRSSQILLHLQKARTLSARWLQALDCLPFGVVLVNKSATVVRMNRAAEQIANKKDGLAVERRRLAAAKPHLTARLRRAVFQASQTTRGDGFCSGEALALERPSLLRPLSVVVAPLPSKSLVGLDCSPQALVLVTDPEEQPEAPDQILVRLFDLTTAESRLASVLMQGWSLEDAADRLRISKETARNQLKSVFWKTDTHRQGQLMRLLLRSPAALKVDRPDSPSGGRS